MPVAPRISVERIAQAYGFIDPVFLDSPQYLSEPISHRLSLDVVLKVETINPIRSFKGRGTDYLLHRLDPHEQGYVCASAGNFGQGLAYAGRKRHRHVTVFAARNANSLKVERMRALGAEVVLAGEDFDEAKAHARARAEATHATFVEDRSLAPIAEGAGTIALELTGMQQRLDAVVVPLGDGALISGIGAWMRDKSPGTKVIGVVADGAPAMDLSWRAHRVVSTATISTIADGIAVREPVAEGLREMENNVDDVVRVTDDEIIDSMRMLLNDAGLVTEPAGAAGLAAAAKLRGELEGQRVSVIVTGGNIAPDDLRRLLF